MSKIDQLSEWLRKAVQGGSKAPLVEVPDPRASQDRGRDERAPVGAHAARPTQSHEAGFNPARKGVHVHPAVKGGRGAPLPPAPKTEAGTVERLKGAPSHKGVLRIIPIGGLEEVGKNCMVFEYEKDIVVVDMGFQFPEDEMFGVDYIIPDIQYLVERKERIRAILITHAHLDHIGALAYVLPDLGFPPVYASKLAVGLIQKQLEEFKMLKQARLKVIDNTQVYPLGRFDVEFFRVNHSIPDAMGISIRCPEGHVIHTGDFKFDFTPADGVPADIKKMEDLGKRGVNILFADSTNALKPGHTMSERVVAENLEKAISSAKGRIVIACFSSLIGRVQQIIDFAAKNHRKVFLSGGSLIANAEIAHTLGFLRFQKDQVHPIKEVTKFADEQVLILTTGGQGEPMAALSRMATGAHAQVKIHAGDTVVVSSSPIIGNEKSVAFLVDALSRLGAEVVHNQIMDVHTSGHGQQEDLKLMMSLVKPAHLVPIHGSFYMRRAHGNLGPQVGIPESHVHMMDNGNVIELKQGVVSLKSEDIKVRYVVVDGEMRGDLGSHVLKEREVMARNGLVTVVADVRRGRIVGQPIISTRGFFHQKEQTKFLRDMEKRARDSIEKLAAQSKSSVSVEDYEQRVRGDLAGLIVQRFDRRPLIQVFVNMV